MNDLLLGVLVSLSLGSWILSYVCLYLVGRVRTFFFNYVDSMSMTYKRLDRVLGAVRQTEAYENIEELKEEVVYLRTRLKMYENRAKGFAFDGEMEATLREGE